MSEVVLDSSALLALLTKEQGADKVETTLPGGLLSSVNLAEVVSKLVERGMPAGDVLELVQGIGVEVVPFDAAQAVIAGELRRTTRAAGLSLGDRACLALARVRGRSALTADSAWKQVTDVDVVFIR